MNDAAPAVAESTPIAAPPPAPVENATDDVVQETTAPVKTTPEPAKVEVVEPKKKTTRDSLEAASKEVNKAETAKAAEVKKAETTPKEVAKPAPKEAEAVKAEPWRDAPKRFNDVEKAEWDKAPDSVKQGIHRAHTELEKGLETYKKDATEYAELNEFKELAKQYKTTLKDAMSNYVAIDKALQSDNPRDKIEAIEEVFRAAKVTPQQIAAYYTGQKPDEAASQTNQTINELRGKVQQLEQHIQGLSTNVEAQQTEQQKAQLNEWAKDKPHAFQLADQIAWHYQQGLSLDDSYAKAVGDAQEFAVSMGFTPPSGQPAITELAAHTPKTQKSIAGAPSPGSFPATQKPSNSIKEAVAKAFAQV